MQKTTLFQNLVYFAAADGKFTEEELEFLAIRAEDWQIPGDEFETALTGVAEGKMDLRLPEKREDRITLLSEMIRLMAADGELAEIEKQLCAQASAKMHFTEGEFEEILEMVLNS